MPFSSASIHSQIFWLSDNIRVCLWRHSQPDLVMDTDEHELEISSYGNGGQAFVVYEKGAQDTDYAVWQSRLPSDLREVPDKWFCQFAFLRRVWDEIGLNNG